MKKIYAIVTLLFISFTTFAQPLTGLKTIPGTAPSGYPTIADAVEDLNMKGVGSNGVIFDIAAGYSETITATLSLSATGTAANPVIFRKSGVGANPVIYAYGGGTGTPATAVQDGIWNLIGSDYITIDGIDLSDPNTTNPETMEYGYGFFKADAGNGCQYNTISNCTITLNRINNVAGSGPSLDGSRAVFVTNSLVNTQTTTLTPTIAAGSNSYNSFYSNVLQNCNIGFAFSGYTAGSPYTAGDTGNDIGGSTPSTGNTIINFGGGGSTAPAAGIRTRSQWGLNISNNLVNNNNGSGINHPTTLRGIFAESGTSANITISNNNITIHGGAISSSIYGIDNGTGTTSASNLVTISDNQVSGSYSTATTGIFYAIQNTATATTVRFENNIISGISVPGTGALYGIATGGPTNMIIQNNQVLNLTKTGNGIIYGIQVGTGSVTCSSNILDGITRNSVTSTSAIYGINSVSSAGIENFSSNIIRNFSAPGATTLNGINISSSSNHKKITANQIYNFTVTGGGVIYAINFGAGFTDTISENQIHDLTISGATSGSIHGIRITAGTLNIVNDNVMHTFSNAGGTSGVIYGISVLGGTTNNLSGNQVYNINTGSSNPSLYGIYITSGATNSCINNMISDLRTPVANAAIPLAGIYASGGTANNIFYNTIFLNGTSAAVSFGSAALYASVNTKLDMRNNILVNLSTPKGAGIAAAYRRSTADLTNYSVNSNTNLFYAGATEDATHTVFYNGSASYAMANFQTLVGPYRESISFREQPPFANILTAPYNLHLLSTPATACESGGLQVILPPAIDTDADHQIRQGNTGYTGTGSAPDVGADEFEGIPSFNCIAPVPGLTYTSSDTICLGEQITLTLQNLIPGTGITYQWQGASGINGTYSDIAGAIFYSLTLSPEQPQYYRCMVICHAGGDTAYSVPVNVVFPNNVTSVTPGSRCAAGTVTLEATVSNGTLNWYANSSGGNAIGTGSPFITPSITSTTSFYAAADILAVNGPVIGAGISTGTGTENPFYHIYGGKKSQYLVKASELTTAGLSAGNITSLAFEVVTPAGTYNSFGISIGHTALTVMTSTLQTGLTSVYSLASLTPVAGINTFTFSAPFSWDGLSNIIIETCWSNNNTGGSTPSVKYDAAGFTAQGYYRANSIAPATFCATTTGTSTTTSRPKIHFNYSPPCFGPRTAVTATINAPPSLVVTGNQTICSGSIKLLQVLSPLSDYDTYTWSPAANIFTDAACTIPYTPMQNAAAVYFSASAAGTYTFMCNATSSANGCYKTSQSSVTVLPANAEIQALPAVLCNSGSTMLTLLPATGYGASLFQWQESTDSVTFTNIPGATTSAYTTPVLTATRHFRLFISNPDEPVCVQPQVTVPVIIPQVTGTTPGSRCGEGTVILAATHNDGGVIKWYADATGGTAIGTGSPFTTPVINGNTTFYAAHQPAASGNATPPGEGTFNSSTSHANPFYGNYANTHNQYLIRATELYSLGFFTGNITSLTIPIVSGTTPLTDFSIRIGQTTVNQLNSFVAENFVQVYHSDTQVPVIGNNVFNFDFPFTWDGTSNLLIEICHGNPASVATIFSTNVNVTTYFFSTIHINHNTPTSGTDVCSDYTSSASIITSRPKFSLAFSGCESARVGVAATLTNPPPVTAVASPSEICRGLSSTITASGSSPDYYYSWMPGELLGDTLQVYPENTTVYVVYANDPVNGCAATDTVVVTVLPTPDPFSIEPFNPTILPDSIIPLTATGINPNITWVPFTNLFSDAAGLIPYIGEPLVTVYASPDISTIYYATSTNTSSGCSAEASVTITVIQNCIPPTQVQADSITQYSAVISWYYPNPLPAMGFEYELRTSGAPGSGNVGLYYTGNVYDTTLSISWLSAQTTYHFYVRAVCGEVIYGAWSADCSFTTLIEPINVTAETGSVSCFGNANGSIYSNVYGGVPPYTLLWSTGDTTAFVTGLVAGSYSLTVTDASGDTVSGTWMVGTPDSLVISFLTQNPTCFDYSNGYIIAYPLGGTFPYSMVWNTGATGYSLSELSQGTYTLTVTDDNGCEAVDSVVLLQPDPVIVSGNITHESCPGAMDGSISLIITGGNNSSPYVYYYTNWSNGAYTDSVSGLSAGAYSVTATDNFGCHGYGSFTVEVTSGICDSISVDGDISGVECYEATQVITVAGNGQFFIVQPSASATFIAGAKIRFLTGTQVLPGGYMLGRIAPSGPFCQANKLTQASQTEEIPLVFAGKQRLVLYPNPTTDNFKLLSIEIPENQFVKVEIFDLKGEKMTSYPWGSLDREFETAVLPAGLYIVRVSAESWIETIKLVKVR